MDATIYALVLTPALKEMLGARATPENIGWYGGIIFAIFLVGWAVGGVLFGIMADYFGRARTLVITILIYAIFTGMAGFFALLVGTGSVPVPDRAGNRRGMGGGGHAGGGGVAGVVAG